MKTLTTGKGNVVKKAEDLRKLGIKNKKSLSSELTDRNEDLLPGGRRAKPAIEVSLPDLELNKH